MPSLMLVGSKFVPNRTVVSGTSVGKKSMLQLNPYYLSVLLLPDGIIVWLKF